MKKAFFLLLSAALLCSLPSCRPSEKTEESFRVLYTHIGTVTAIENNAIILKEKEREQKFYLTESTEAPSFNLIIGQKVVILCAAEDEPPCDALSISLYGAEAPVDAVSLPDKYPEYFKLDASEGLCLYVWQMAEGSYSFALFSASDNRSASELLTGLSNIKGASAGEMRYILSSYEIVPEKIRIVPFMHPLSSYIPPCFLSGSGVAMDLYLDNIREMLFY